MSNKHMPSLLNYLYANVPDIAETLDLRETVVSDTVQTMHKLLAPNFPKKFMRCDCSVILHSDEEVDSLRCDTCRLEEETALSRATRGATRHE